MASKVDINVNKTYCDSLFGDLEGMKMRLNEHYNDALKSSDKRVAMRAAHLQDIIRTIEWKQQILLRDCSIEFTDVVTPSVESSEEVPYAGGFVGG